MSNRFGKLYLVPTPIGNLDDLSKRVIDTLNEVAIVACEDTRRTGTLLKRLNLNKKLLSYHDFNESKRAKQLLDLLQRGQSVAVVTDAGSPGISDPAYRIVRAAIEKEIEIVPLPGPCSIIPALTASGLPTDRFFFEGFLAQRAGPRRRRLEQLSGVESTLLFFESPYRLLKSLADMHEILGDRQSCVAREISKLHEEFIRGKLSEVIDSLTSSKIRGEIVVVVHGEEVEPRKKRRMGSKNE